ncbi:hypothetical protein ACHAQH_001805 [Verticillium albo-atrum]
MSLPRKPDMESILKSPIILFMIGLEHEEFRVHECVLLPLSPRIRADLTAGAQTGVVDKFLWEDVEPATFAGLIEFAYGADYTTDVFPDQPEDGGEDVYNLREWIYGWNGKKGEIYKHGLQFVESGLDTPEGYFPSSGEDVKRLPFDQIDFSATIFRHLKLYVLAKRSEIKILEHVCIDRFRNCLIRLPWERCDEDFFLSITRYIWANTPEGERSPLRKVWIDFILCDLDCLVDGRLEDPIRCIKNFGTEFLLSVPHGYWQELQDVRNQKAKK